jgi:hypothetical protein
MPPYPGVDLEAALGTARTIGQEQNRQQKRQPIHGGTAHLPLTIESAVADATKPDVIVESRGAAGEYIVEGRNFRCVTPLLAPRHLEGVSMLTQCAKKR